MIGIANFIRDNDGKCKYIISNEQSYTIQVYEGASQGNIKGQNQTVLCRFCIDWDKQILYVAFSKDNIPQEFGYKTYAIHLTSDIEEVKKIEHRDAARLYRVFVNMK